MQWSGSKNGNTQAQQSTSNSKSVLNYDYVVFEFCVSLVCKSSWNKKHEKNTNFLKFLVTILASVFVVWVAAMSS